MIDWHYQIRITYSSIEIEEPDLVKVGEDNGGKSVYFLCEIMEVKTWK